jgi:hypothetical protein
MKEKRERIYFLTEFGYNEPTFSESGITNHRLCRVTITSKSLFIIEYLTNISFIDLESKFVILGYKG